MLRSVFIVISFLSLNIIYSKELDILIKISNQKMYILNKKDTIKIYDISSSKYGTGSKYKSKKTPLGKHFIVKKIGENYPLGTIFDTRMNTKKISPIYTKKAKNYTPQDIITSRILWLKGKEKWKNLNGDVDSYYRHIYIHGTNEEWKIGTPSSNGCIRMKNIDIIELFDIIKEKTNVNIIN